MSVSTPATRPLAWAVLATAVLQVVAPIITVTASGSTPGASSGPDLLITPVGWAFAIWGVIYTLALAQAIAVLARSDQGIPRRLQVDQVVLYAGGALWIAMSETGSSLATAAALLLMLVAAVDGVLTASRADISPRGLSVLTRASVGLYAGWVTAAFFLNVSTALVDAGVVEASDLGWQLAVLVVAAVVLVVLVAATRSNLAYAAAGVWALVGIAVTGSDNGDSPVLVLALVAAVVLVAAAVATRLRPGGPLTRASA